MEKKLEVILVKCVASMNYRAPVRYSLILGTEVVI